MSRSYRKPYLGDSYGSSHRKWAKRQAAKTVRRAKDVPDGRAYRKFFNPWNITDYICRVEKPNPDGRFMYWLWGKQRWETYEEMVIKYRRATVK